MTPDLHSPLGFSTLRIKAFNRYHHKKLASPDARLSFAPRSVLFRLSLRINARNSSSSCQANRSRALAGPEPFARPEPVRGSTAIRLRSLRLIRLRCILCPRSLRAVSGAVPEHAVRQRLTALWMRTPRAWSSLRRLEEPSPKSSRPLTSLVVLGHHRFGSKPTDSCRFACDSAAYEDGFTRLTRIVPPSSPVGE